VDKIPLPSVRLSAFNDQIAPVSRNFAPKNASPPFSEFFLIISAAHVKVSQNRTHSDLRFYDLLLEMKVGTIVARIAAENLFMFHLLPQCIAVD
jgi:hypothetical protein